MRTILQNEKAERWFKAASWLLMAAWTILFLVTIIFYHAKNNWIGVLLWPTALVGLFWLVRGGYRKCPVYWLAAAFVLWYAVVRIFLGNAMGAQTWYYLAELAVIYLFILPFAKAGGDELDLRAFDLVAGIVVLVMTLLSVLGLLAVPGGETRAFPGGGRVLISLGLYGRLSFFELNPNICGMFLAISLLLTVYLTLRRTGRVWRIAGVIAAVIQFLAIAATDCRTAILALTAASAVVGAVAADRLIRRGFRGRGAALALAGVAAAAICFGAASLSVRLVESVWGTAPLTSETEEATQEETDAVADDTVSYVASETTESETADSDDETTTQSGESMLTRDLVDFHASGRMAIYSSFFSYLKDHPQVLLSGADSLSIRLMTRYGREDGTIQMHLHNAFFQTLASTGLPGLALILALCVLLLVYSLRILFDPKRSLAEKMLPVLLLLFIVDAMAECPIFVPYDQKSNSFFNLFFFLCAGYVVQLGQKKKETTAP